jgi:hypothetical protein
MTGDGLLSRRQALLSGGVVATSFVAGCSSESGSATDEPEDSEEDTPRRVESTFDDGKEGWSVVDMETHAQTSDPNWGEVIETLEFTHESSSGVDDTGYVSHLDTTSGVAFFFTARDAFLGDMSAFAGGQLEFALRSSHNDVQRDAGVVFQGQDTVVTTQFDRPQPEWTTYTITLDADERTYHESNLNGEEVTQATLEEVLSNLQALRISGEHSGRDQETVGLDEVRLLSA